MIRSRKRMLALSGLLTLVASAAIALVAAPAQAFPASQGWGEVYNGASTRCLDSGIPANAQLWKCSGSIYQSWVFTGTGRIRGNSPSGCLDDGAGVNGSGAFLAACNGSSSQAWYFGANNSIVNAASGRCLDADTGTIGQQGTKVQVWDCWGGANQMWWFQYVP